MFTQPFVQAQIEENIKAPRHWSLWEEFTDDRWFPRAKASNAEMVSFDDVIMMQYTWPCYNETRQRHPFENIMGDKCYFIKGKSPGNVSVL